jgi:ribose 5-phosphate isomerase B
MAQIDIGCDHAGYALKEQLQQILKARGYDVRDHGAYSLESVDYPDYAHQVATAVESNENLGILICGSANGVAMAANKHAGIRAAICWNKEIALLARHHNDANILCLPARFLSPEQAEEITEAFLSAPFEGGRHAKRVNKIPCM